MEQHCEKGEIDVIGTQELIKVATDTTNANVQWSTIDKWYLSFFQSIKIFS